MATLISIFTCLCFSSEFRYTDYTAQHSSIQCQRNVCSHKCVHVIVLWIRPVDATLFSSIQIIKFWDKKRMEIQIRFIRPKIVLFLSINQDRWDHCIRKFHFCYEHVNISNVFNFKRSNTTLNIISTASNERAHSIWQIASHIILFLRNCHLCTFHNHCHFDCRHITTT